MSEVLPELEGGVLTVSLNRPEVGNAWSIPLEWELFGVLDAAAADPEVRAVVLTGAGKAFCVAADMSQLGDAETLDLQLDSRRPLISLLTFPKPLICAINGPCAGLGLAVALMTDVRFVSRTAKLTTAFARRGLPGEFGLAWVLPRLVGPEVALDLLLSGRTFLGDEMHTLGLASRLCDADDVVAQAQSYARELARWSSPRAVATIRRQVWRGLDQTVAEHYDEAKVQMQRYLTLPDITEGLGSFLERREPVFEGLPAGFDPLAS